MSASIEYNDRTTYCPPLLKTDKSGAKTNDSPDVLWGRFEEQDVIFAQLPNQWYVIFPDGNYVPEDSDDTHVMISPRVPEAFTSINTLSESNLLPIATMLLKFIKVAGPEGFAGYNIGIDRTRSTPQTWDNFHIHLLRRGELIYKEVRRGNLPIKLREPALPYISSLADYVLREYSERGIRRLIDPREGVFHGFPVSGAIAELESDITGGELIQILKHIDSSYSMVHKQIASSFFTNYDEAVTSHGVLLFSLRSPKEIVNNLGTLTNIINQNGELNSVFRYLLTLAKSAGRSDRQTVIKDWDEFVLSQKEKGAVVDTEKKLITAPSYSVSLACRNEKYYLAFAPHFFRQAGSQDILGTLTPRVYKEGEKNSQRKQRGRLLAQEIVELIG